MKVFYVVDDGYYAAKDISDVEKALIGFLGEEEAKVAFEGCYEVTRETEMLRRWKNESKGESYNLYEIFGRHVFINGDKTTQLTYENY